LTSEEKPARVTRRSLLKWSGALAGAVVVGGVVGVGADMLVRPTSIVNQQTTQPPAVSLKAPLSADIQGRVDTIFKDLSARHAGETTSYFICNTYTRDGRDDGCKKVHFKNGKLTAIESDDTINPNIAREDETWDNILKGRYQNRSHQRFLAYRKMIYDPARLLYPMKKVGARADPNSAYVRVSWDEALNAIANAIKNSINKYGPYSLYDVSQLWTLPNWLNAGVTGWSIFSFPGHTFERFAAFQNEGYGSSSQLLDIFNAKLIVLWASTPSEGATNDVKYFYHLAHEKGIPVISISPRYTESDEISCDQWIPIRVGTDTAMQLGVANVLIKENLYNADFVNKWVYGFDKWRAYVMGTSDGVEKTPEWAEPLTGVPATTIREFARYIAKMTPCILHTGAGGSRATLTENFAWAGIMLSAMLGNMGKPGAYCSCAGQGPSGWYSAGTPSVSGQYGRKAATFSSPSLMALMKMSDAVLQRPNLDAGKMTKDQYNQLIGNDSANPVPNIRVWCPTHYAIQMQMASKKQIEACKLLDFTFTMRNRADDTTARVMDYVLPLAEEMERDPNFQGMSNGFVLCQKLLQTQGESKSEEWMWAHIAKLLGVLDTYFPIFSKYSDDTWDQMWVDMCKAAYNAWAATDAAKALNPPTWDDFLKKPVMRWDMQGTPTYAFKTEIVDGKGFTTTSSGKIQAYNDYIAKGTDFLKTTKYGGYIDPYPAYNYPLQFGGFHEKGVDDRPLVLMTTQPKYHTHSWSVNNPWLKNELWEHSVQLSVPDAKARGIKDGDHVAVIGDEGWVTHMTATVTSRLTPGTVHIWKGTYFNPDPYSGNDTDGCINAIQTDKACPAKTYPNMSRVQVVKE